MFGACVVMMAAVVGGVDKSETKKDSEVVQRESLIEQRHSLQIYLAKMKIVIEIGRFDEAYFQNVLTVVEQLTETRTKLAVLPEEALCVEREGLYQLAEFRKFIAARVNVGSSPEANLKQVNAAYDAARLRYVKTITKCLASLE